MKTRRHELKPEIRISSWLCVLTLGLLAAPPAIAQLRDLPEGRDHPTLSRYAGSIIIGYDARNFDEFELPLGPIRRLDSGSVVQELDDLVNDRLRLRLDVGLVEVEVDI